MKCKKYLLATRDTNYAGDTLYVEEGYIDFKLFSSRKKAEERLKKQLEELIWEAGRLNPSRFNFAEWGGKDSVTLVDYIRRVWKRILTLMSSRLIIFMIYIYQTLQLLKSF